MFSKNTADQRAKALGDNKETNEVSQNASGALLGTFSCWHACILGPQLHTSLQHQLPVKVHRSLSGAACGSCEPL